MTVAATSPCGPDLPPLAARRAAAVLVTIVSVTNQAGPALIEYGINDGMLPHHQSFAVVVGVEPDLPGRDRDHRAAQRSQARVTGRLAARVMNDLRVRVFTHLQRLGLDFYTDEQSGVIMTRMTSDIENLQQLLQDGLAQLVVQALTMVVITVVLFTLNVELALITIALVVPAADGRVAVVSRRRRSAAMTASGTGSRACSPTCRRACTASARSPPTTARSATSSQHRNVVGDYREANNYTAQINAIYGPGTTDARLPGPGGAAGDRRSHGRSITSWRSARWWLSSST